MQVLMNTHAQLRWEHSPACWEGKLGKMLLSALRGRLWHLQMKQSQLHPERRDQCNTGDIRNLIFKIYFAFYLLSQCPNILLSTAKLSFNLFSRDPNSNRTTTVQGANLSFCHQSQSLTYFWDRGMQEWGASPREQWHSQLCRWWHWWWLCPFPAIALLVHHKQFLPRAHKGQQSITASPGVSLGRGSCAPSLWQNEAGHSHSPAVAKCRNITMSPHPPEGPTVPWQKSAGYKSVWTLFESKLANLFKEQD